MAKVIIYERPDGGISVVRPTGEIPIEQVLTKDVPQDAVNPQIIEASELPQKNKDRNFWVRQSGVLKVDSAKVSEYESSEEFKSKKFNLDKMTHDMGVKFKGVDAVALAPYVGAVQSYAKARNFKDLKSFVAGLVSLGKATQEQADNIYGVFMDQGIDLGSY